MDWVPVLEHVGDGFEATSSYPPGTSVASVHGPVHQVALVWVQLQQQRDCFTAQLVNLGKDRSDRERKSGAGCMLRMQHAFTAHHHTIQSTNSQLPAGGGESTCVSVFFYIYIPAKLF